MSLRIGVPESIPTQLLDVFPAEATVIRIPATLDKDLDIDLWVVPPSPEQAGKIWPHLKGVKVVQSMLAGADWLIRLIGHSALLCDAQGAHNISTSEWAVTAVLAMYKYLPMYILGQQNSNWGARRQAATDYAKITGDHSPQMPPICVEELAGKKVLIVGYGAIGKCIEQRLLPFEVEITRVARRARPEQQVYAIDSLAQLIPAADVVILIVPLTSQTIGLFGAKEFALMQQGALLVNAARGPVVDTQSLIDTLNSGRIRAAVDVTEPEPLPSDHPLWKCPNLLITPHVAGSTPQFSPRAIQIAADQARRMIAGLEPINVVREEY